MSVTSIIEGMQPQGSSHLPNNDNAPPVCACQAIRVCSIDLWSSSIINLYVLHIRLSMRAPSIYCFSVLIIIVIINE
jgi:hypothetical protein